MAVIKSWAGTGLVDGATVDNTTAGTGDATFNTVTAGTFTVDASGGRPPRVQADQLAATAAQLIWSGLGTLTAYAVRGYLQMTAWPSAGAPILQTFASSSLAWRLDITSTGLIRLRNASNTVVDTSVVAVPTGAEVRIEVVVSAATATAKVYTGDSITPQITLSGSVGSSADEVRWGNTQTSPTWPTHFWDGLAVANTAAEIGPIPAAFPDAPLDVRVELLLGTWIDIKALGHVYTRDPITITGGMADEGSQADPASCTLTLNNKDGRYSPRNPLSPYYGLLGRNTPLRVSVPYGETFLDLGPEDRISTPDSSALSITGDIDVRVDVTAQSWRAENMLMSKARFPGTQQESWVLWADESGRLRFWWSPTGTFAGQRTTESTVLLPVSQGRLAVRATLDVNNGASGCTVTFFTAPTITGTWTQLGAPVVAAGTTSIFDGTAPVDLGKSAELSSPGLIGRYHAAEIRNGIGGTVVARPDVSAQAPGASTFADPQGNTWTLNGDSLLTDRDVRFMGEVPSWPVRWDTSGQDVYVQIEAAGIQRRLGQGAKALRSALHRAVSVMDPPLQAYWPLEDGENTTVAASGIQGRPGMAVSGRVAFGSEGAPPGGSGAAGFADAGKLVGSVTMPEAAGWCVSFYITLPETIAADDWGASVGWTMPGAETYTRFQTLITTEDPIPDNIGRMILAVFDRAGVAGFPSMATKNLLGKTSLITILAEQDSGFCFLEFYVDGVLAGDTVPGYDTLIDTTSAITGVTVNEVPADGSLVSPPAVGEVSHVMIGQPEQYLDIHSTAVPAGLGYVGEHASVRITRLCAEEGVPVRVVGTGSATAEMGPQKAAPLLDLLGECADADGGALGERREALSLAYRTRSADYGTIPSITLTYPDEVAAPLEPVDDDQQTRNDVTVERDGGSSARVVRTDGPLSVSAPPDGVGIYDEAVTLNVADDSTLLDQAGWRLHLGTWDEARYPIVRVKLHKNPHLIRPVLDAGVRAHLRLTGLPEWVPPGQADLIVQGYTEVIEQLRWTIEYNTVPAGPWQVGVVDDLVLGRADTDGSSLAAGVTSTATTLSVATDGAWPLWTTSGAEFPFDIRVGGEVVTVTAISGTTSPQTFTVTRATNGIVKAHTAGADVRLATPAITAL